MLYCDIIDVFEGIDINRTSAPKECDICHYQYFLNKGFQLQAYVCNRCNDLLRMSMNLSDLAILKFKKADYCCIITGISKSEALNLMKKIDLTEKSREL